MTSMKLWHKQITQTGDTIVEVLIAVAIISSVLAGAFLVAQNSAKAVRDSQEHGEMTQILQSQVELIRSMTLAAEDTSAAIYDTSPRYFCIDPASPAKPASPQRVNFPVGYTLPSVDSDTYNYPGICKNIQERYNLAATYNATTEVFTVYGRWDRLGGGKNQEMLSYRIGPGSAVLQAPTSFTLTPQSVTPPTQPTQDDDSVDGDTLLIGFHTGGLGCYVDNMASGQPIYPDCWTISLINGSVNDPSTIDHCTFDWGDGSAIVTYAGTDIHCQHGSVFLRHVYPNKGTQASPYRPTASLINYFNNGAAPKPYIFNHIHVPY